ncbi:MAG: response regulator [Candidatus Neomarinimicrobiota bacterium]
MEQKNITILIVDDTAANLQILTSIVTSEGYNILLAQTGEEALHLANKYHPDIILLDVIMPQMDGFSICRQLKANPATRPIPVIFVTSRTDVEAVEKGFDVGGDDYVSKPFNSRVLLARLKNHVERFQRERELSLNRERLNTALDAAQIGSFTIRLPSREWFPDEQLRRLFGIESAGESFELKTWYDKIIEEDREASIAKIERCIAKSTFTKFDFRIRNAENKIKWFRCSMQIGERNDKNEVLLIVGVNVDTTKEQNMLQTIHEQEESIAQSRKLKAMGQLTGGIAHDFNNMLATILGFSELLADELKDDEELSYYCENITTTCERAASLTKQLLTFSRKSGNITTVIDLHALIKNTMELLRHSIKPNIKLKHNCKAKEHFILGENSPLQNIILNMGFNARDAMSDGGVIEITTENVRITPEEAEHLPMGINTGYYILLKVKDSGHGMEKEVLDKIFEPFFTTKGQGKGTGLGLSTAYGTINAHNGYIYANSVLGEGTTFYIYFPLTDLKPQFINDIPQNSGTKKIIAGGTILIIDDEAPIRKMLRKTLEYVGFDVLEAKSGRLGLKTFEEEQDKITAIILDVIMPEMDGVEVYRELIKIDPKARVLISTGYASSHQTMELEKMGVKNFLQKPYRQSEVVNAVNTLHEVKDNSKNEDNK